MNDGTALSWAKVYLTDYQLRKEALEHNDALPANDPN
jgi:hypothetical protein